MHRSLAALVASSLLGVIAVAALVTGVFFVFGAWTTQRAATGMAFDVGAIAALIIGVLTIGYAVLAALAAREEWLSRPTGAVFGLVVALVAVLASLVSLVEGRSQEAEELLYMAAGLGAGTALAVLVAARAESAGVTRDRTA